MFGVIMPLCIRMFCCIFGWYFYIEIRLKFEKNILLSSSRAFSLSTLVENSEATWKKPTKCNQNGGFVVSIICPEDFLGTFWHHGKNPNCTFDKKKCESSTYSYRSTLWSEGRDIHIEYSKQFEWNLYFYVSGQSRPFWAALKLL